MDTLPTGIPGPAYRVRTRRLSLRCWEPTDAAALKAAIDASLEHLRPWMPWANDQPEDLQTMIERLRRWRGKFDLGRDFVYGVFSLDERKVLGGSGLHTRVGERAREIGYWIHVDHINQGLATEVAAALTKVAFEIDAVLRVEIHCGPRNLRSAAVPEKLGFVHEATLRQRVRDAQGEPRDTMIWTLLADEYTASVASKAEIEAFDAVGRRIL
ncbi:MAG: GNAT family protein [Anaerolineae bacterium]